ncbi:MAG: hypothetical protein NT030_00530 [Candidatus Saganbacteria bacterium]|nr:hypothetical protein [Candidatus Saganbacteria bacterium]
MDKMETNHKKDRLQFIVNDGIIYNKRDILMLLRDLGNVAYFETFKGKIVNKGKGYIMRVCANSEDPTLFLSGRVYINVNIFDYMKVNKVKGGAQTLFELINGDRVIKLIPDESAKLQAIASPSLFAEKLMELRMPMDDILPGEDTDELFPEGPLEN